MIIWTFFNQKGGVGKTTTAMGVASALTQMGYNATLVDTDPQCSAQKWESRTEDSGKNYPPVSHKVESINGLTEQEFAQWVTKRQDGVDFMLIDTPPKLSSSELSAALFVCDVAVLPMNPHVTCTDAIEELIPLVHSISQRRGDPINIQVLLNRYSGRRASEKDIIDNIGDISPWPVLVSRLKDFAGYADAHTFRTSVFSLPNTAAARNSLDALTRELIEITSATISE